MEATASADSFLSALREGVSALSRRRRFLVAVSGGRDSVALLHGLLELDVRKLVVVHLDHSLRGSASRADIRFVRALAARLGLPLIAGRADVRGYAKARGVSVETAARELRHVFFARCARDAGCRSVLLAHHADDQIETCLFNYLRGAGAAGLAGMRFETSLSVQRTRLRLLRPMLHIRRSGIDAYTNERGLRFREDATNAELDATRNRVRHRILPVIRETFGESAGSAILRASAIFSDEDNWMESMIPKIDGELDVRLLRGLPIALLRRTLRRWLATRGAFEISFEQVEAVRAMLPAGARIAKINLPGGRHVRRRAGILFLE